MNTFIEQKRSLLNSLPALTGDAARLAHSLSEALNRLEAIVSQADAQFRAGDRHATFGRQLIRSLNNPELF